MLRFRVFRTLTAAAVVLLPMVMLAGPAAACACCSSEGQRFVGVQPIDAYAAGLIGEIRFAEAAQLFSSEADPQDLAGVTAASNKFQLADAKTDSQWSFRFSGGSDGSLTFQLPKSITKFEVDPREADAHDRHNGPLLYKEWRLTTKAKGNGMLNGATGGDQQATLILHGRGNSCTDASQFTAWTLVLHGSKATVTFFGNLVP